MVHRAWLVGGLVAALQSGGSAARAEGFALDRLSTAEAGSEWFVLDTLDLKSALQPAVSLTGSLAHRPLATYGAGGALRTAVVDHQALLHLGASVVVHEQVRLGLSIPVVVFQDGATEMSGGTSALAPAGSAALGDVRFSATARLFGAGGAPFSLAAGVQLFIPSGSRAQYSGDETLRILGRLMAAGEVGAFVYALQFGAQHRTVAADFGAGTIGNEAQVAAALGVRLAGGRLLIGPEFFGATVISEPRAVLTVSNTPMELLLGAHLRLPGGVRLGVGGGVGLLHSIGAPQARFVLSVGWQPEAGISAARPPAPESRPSVQRGEAESEPRDPSDQLAPDQEAPDQEASDQVASDQVEGPPSSSSGSTGDSDGARGPMARLVGTAPGQDLGEAPRAPPLRERAGVVAPRVRGQRDEPSAATGLDAAVVTKVLAKSARALRACLEAQLRRNPGFKGGRVVLGLRIKPSGVVGEATLQPRKFDGAGVGACLKDKARRIVFPTFEGDPMDVEFPLVLGSGG